MRNAVAEGVEMTVVISLPRLPVLMRAARVLETLRPPAAETASR